MQAVYGFVLKYLLELVFKRVQKYFSKEADKIIGKVEVVKKVNDLNEAVKAAYNGEKITDDQSRKIIDAARILIQSYRV